MRQLFLAIHHPKPEHVDDLVRAMTQFGSVLASTEGMLHASAWRGDEQIVAISIWDSRDHLVAAGPTMAAAVADVPFAAWEARPRELLTLEEIPTAGSPTP